MRLPSMSSAASISAGRGTPSKASWACGDISSLPAFGSEVSSPPTDPGQPLEPSLNQGHDLHDDLDHAPERDEYRPGA